MVEVRTFHTDALSSTTPGLSGASHIGIPSDIEGARATELENALRELYAAGGGVATVSGLGTVRVSVSPADPNSPVAIEVSEKGAASGVATLGADGKVPSGQLPADAVLSVNGRTGAVTFNEITELKDGGAAETFRKKWNFAGDGVIIEPDATDPDQLNFTISGAAAGAASETAAGITEQATEAEVQAGTAGNLFATVARLKAELDRREVLPAPITPTLTNGWVAHGAGTLGPGYYKDRRDFVFLQGSIKGGGVGGGTGPFTLPEGYRPPADVYFSVDSAGSLPGKVRVLSTGAVEVVQPTENVRVSLNGVFFRSV